MAIGVRLREERERLGYTQDAFAEIAGSSKRSQIGWEKGRSCPDGNAFAAWSVIGLDVGYVITGKKSEVPNMAPDEELLLDSYRQLSTGERRQLLSGILSGSALGGGGNQVNVSGNGGRVAGGDFYEGKKNKN